MSAPGLDILRPAGATELISARTFEPAFVDGLASHVSIRSVPVEAWLEPLFGAGDVPRPVAAARLREAATAAFLAPAQRALALAPELTRLRNLGRAAVRMLIIAHAPGAFLPEWALLEPLLRPGDRIVAPSRRAAEVLARLCPDLSRFVRVMPHPIPPLPVAPRPAASGRRLVSLSRVVGGKLIHRQVEAMAILRRRGWNDLRMDIAGPLNELGAAGLSAYVRSIQAKIRRLELDDRVALLGVVEDDAAKAELLSGAALLLNLSVTVEESFGKSIVEANGCGIPCLVTDWGGLAEAVGDAGQALPVERHPYGVDVSAERIADAIEALLRSPPSPEQCRRQAARSAPDRVARGYRQLLDDALAEAAAAGVGPASHVDEPLASTPAAPRRGLLAATAPLTALRWAEVMDMHEQEVLGEPDLRGLGRPEVLLPGAQLRGLLTLGVMSEVQRAQAGLPAEEDASPVLTAMPEGDFLARCSMAAQSPGTRSSRVVCLNLLYQLGHYDEVRRGLARLRAEGRDSPGMRYLAVELERIGGVPSAAVSAALAGDDDAPWGEHEAHRVIQLARIHRDRGHADDARFVLERWLDRHPDGPEAAEAWQLLAVCRLESGTERDVALAREAIVRALALRGPWPELERLAGMLQPADDEQ